MSSVNVQEVVVKENSPCDGASLMDISWPRDCIIASLRRGWRVIVPHGNTILQAGDVLVVVAEPEVMDEVRGLCQKATRTLPPARK